MKAHIYGKLFKKISHKSNFPFDYPDWKEIKAHNKTAIYRSPYISGKLRMPLGKHFYQYSIDFKSQDFPTGTYCCLANWNTDFADFCSKYPDAHTEYNTVYGYAGLQNTTHGKVAILSIWDIMYTDEQSKPAVLRPDLVYPASTKNDTFDGEGTGAHCLVPYDWKEDHWYHMTLQRTFSPEGTALIEQWICDLETDVCTKLCVYDTKLKEACFSAPIFFFLENYIPKYSGHVRSMEVRNITLTERSTEETYLIKNAYLYPYHNMTYVGSYAHGKNEDTFWMVTSGVE